MNYIAEINSFYNWVTFNPLPADAQALWHVLMQMNNRCAVKVNDEWYWRVEFSISNMTVSSMLKFSRQQLDRMRNVLIQAGRISYKKGKGNQSGTYKIIPFDKSYVDNYVDNFPERLWINTALNNVTQDDTQIVTQTDTQTGHNLLHKPDTNSDLCNIMSTLINSSSIKNNNIYNNSFRDDEETDAGMIVVDYYRKLTGNDVTPNRLQLIDGYIGDGAEPELICALLDYAVESNVRNVWQYAEAALRANLDKGITTLAVYREEQEKRKREIERDKARKKEGLPVKSKFNNYTDPNKIDYDVVQKKIMADMLED